MFTQCPGCQTLFRITRRELGQAGGRVRCGLCQNAFDASARLRDRLPPELDYALGSELGERVRRTVLSQATDSSPPPAEPPPRLRLPSPEAAAQPLPPGSAPGLGADERPPESVAAEPGDWGLATALEMEQSGTSPAGRGIPWGRLAACLVLAVTLAGQYLYFQRRQLALDPDWRPAVAAVCAVAGCELPLVRRPGEVGLVDRVLRLHPDRPGAMLLTATVVNRGTAQPWPQLGLTLRRLNGSLAGRRWFAPAEYLAVESPQSLLERPMPPDRAFPVRLAVLDPGGGVENFELDFR